MKYIEKNDVNPYYLRSPPGIRSKRRNKLIKSNLYQNQCFSTNLTENKRRHLDKSRQQSIIFGIK